MECYIVLYRRGDGSRRWVRFTADNAPPPSRNDEIFGLGDAWEGEEFGDRLEISGPFPVPKSIVSP